MLHIRLLNRGRLSPVKLTSGTRTRVGPSVHVVHNSYRLDTAGTKLVVSGGHGDTIGIGVYDVALLQVSRIHRNYIRIFLFAPGPGVITLFSLDSML